MRQDKRDSLKFEVSSAKSEVSTACTSHFKRPIANSRPGGFTFVELLATVVLIAIIMPVAMRSIGLCTRVAGLSRRQIEAASLAKAKLTELTVTRDWENGTQRGDFGTDWPGYEWAATVTNWTDSAVRQLDLTVSWRSLGKPRGLTLSTLVYPQEES
jgi:prepilin-type N-terminal cleavage/methylation domain-containing protein